MKRPLWLIIVLLMFVASGPVGWAKGLTDEEQTLLVVGFERSMAVLSNASSGSRIASDKRSEILRIRPAGRHIREAEARMLSELAGKHGEELAVEIGQVLLLLGPEELAKVEQLAAEGKIPAGRAQRVAAEFKKVQEWRGALKSESAENRRAAFRGLFDMYAEAPEEVRAALKDADPGVRLWALVAADRLASGSMDWGQILSMRGDADENVRLQATIMILGGKLDTVRAMVTREDVDERTALSLLDFRRSNGFASEWIQSKGLKEPASIDRLRAEAGYQELYPPAEPPGPWGPIVAGGPVPAAGAVATLTGASAERRTQLRAALAGSRLPPQIGWDDVPGALSAPMPALTQHILVERQGRALQLLSQAEVSSNDLADLAAMPANRTVDFAMWRVLAAMVESDPAKTFEQVREAMAKLRPTDAVYLRYADALMHLDSRNLNKPAITDSPTAAAVFFELLDLDEGIKSPVVRDHFRKAFQTENAETARAIWGLFRAPRPKAVKGLWDLVSLVTQWNYPPGAELSDTILQEGHSTERLALLGPLVASPYALNTKRGVLGAMTDRDARVREALVQLAYRQSAKGFAPGAEKVVEMGLFDADPGVRTAAFKSALVVGYSWMKNPGISKGMVKVLSPENPDRAVMWDQLASTSNGGTLRNDAAFERLLIDAVWDESPQIQAAARRIWSERPGPLPPGPPSPVLWIVAGVEAVFCLMVLSLAGVGGWRARRLEWVPARINSALLSAGAAGILTGVVAVVLTLLLVLIILFGAGPMGRQMLTLALLTISIFGCCGLAIIGWAESAKSGRMVDGIVLLVMAGLGMLVFVTATVLDLGVLILGLTVGVVQGATVFRLGFDVILGATSVVTVVQMIRAWTTRAVD